MRLDCSVNSLSEIRENPEEQNTMQACKRPGTLQIHTAAHVSTKTPICKYKLIPSGLLYSTLVVTDS